MKKYLLFLVNLSAILAMAACSAVSTSNQAVSQTQTAASGTTQLPTLTKLVVGSFKIIGSSTTITADQAKEMIILWKAYKELQTRDTKAQQEVTDLVSQIQSTFTPDQLAAIDKMDLSFRDVMSLAQELGVSSFQGASQTGTTSSGSSSSSRSGNTGGFPGGGIPPDLGGGGGGFFVQSNSSNSRTASTPSASMRATITARRAGSTASTATIAAQMIPQLIAKLETIANPG